MSEEGEFMQALYNGSAAEIKSIIGRGKCTANSRLGNGKLTPLIVCAAQGHELAIRCLCELGANINTPNDIGRTPLFLTSSGGHVPATSALIALGANVRTPSLDGWTPIVVAASAGHVDIIKVLAA